MVISHFPAMGSVQAAHRCICNHLDTYHTRRSIPPQDHVWVPHSRCCWDLIPFLLEGRDVQVQKTIVPHKWFPCHGRTLLEDASERLWSHTVAEMAGNVWSLAAWCAAGLALHKVSLSFNGVIKLTPRIRLVPSLSHQEETGVCAHPLTPFPSWVSWRRFGHSSYSSLLREEEIWQGCGPLVPSAAVPIAGSGDSCDSGDNKSLLSGGVREQKEKIPRPPPLTEASKYPTRVSCGRWKAFLANFLTSLSSLIRVGKG